MDRERLIAELRGLRPLLEREGVTHLDLFGSRARGDHRADTDVDLVIDVDASRKFSLLDLVGVTHTVGDRIGLPASIILRRSLDPSFAASIAADRVAVF